MGFHNGGSSFSTALRFPLTESAMLSRARSVLPFCSVPFFTALVALCLGIVANMVTQSLLPAPLAVQIRKAFWRVICRRKQHLVI